MQIYFVHFLLFITAFIVQCYCANVRVFDRPSSGGSTFNLIMDYEHHSDCANLPINWMNRVSSINTGNLCIEMFPERDCKGNKISLYPGTPHDALSYWMFDDKLVSLKVCDEPINYEHVNRHTVRVYLNNRDDFLLNVFSCVDVPSSWSKNMKKVDTYTTCFKYYSGTSCKSAMAPPTNPNIITDTGYLYGVQSIGRCDTLNSSITTLAPTSSFKITQTPLGANHTGTFTTKTPSTTRRTTHTVPKTTIPAVTHENSTPMATTTTRPTTIINHSNQDKKLSTEPTTIIKSSTGNYASKFSAIKCGADKSTEKCSSTPSTVVVSLLSVGAVLLVMISAGYWHKKTHPATDNSVAYSRQGLLSDY